MQAAMSLPAQSHVAVHVGEQVAAAMGLPAQSQVEVQVGEQRPSVIPEAVIGATGFRTVGAAVFGALGGVAGVGDAAVWSGGSSGAVALASSGAMVPWSAVVARSHPTMPARHVRTSRRERTELRVVKPKRSHAHS